MPTLGVGLLFGVARRRVRTATPTMAVMVTAIVFVNAEVDQIPEVAQAIAEIDGVSEVYSVTGALDLIALVRVSDHDQVAQVVADQLNKIAGVTSTETHIAFRTYSARLLEEGFAVGNPTGQPR